MDKINASMCAYLALMDNTVDSNQFKSFVDKFGVQVITWEADPETNELQAQAFPEIKPETNKGQEIGQLFNFTEEK